MTDLIIIGSGPGGYQAAAYAAKNGLNVTIIEEGDAGGTCLNCGCIPTKSLCHDAENPVDFAAAMARKDAVVAQLRMGVEQLMQTPGITLVRGHGSLQADGSVLVTADDGQSPSRFEATNIILATGSRAKMPPIPGISLPGVVTSTELLAIDHVPARLCIIGAGVIGLELAGIFAAFGSQVTVVEFMKECLPQMDGDIAKRLRKQLEKSGITFYMGAGVKEIVTANSTPALSVVFEQKGKTLSADADTVLVATGRAANTEGLGTPDALSALGIQADRRGILVNPNTFQVTAPDGFAVGDSTLPRIFAIGDVNGLSMLAHAAEAQAHRVVNTILGRNDHIRFDVIPAAVFTTPEVACVGPTDEQLKAEGRDIIVHKATFRANGRALCIGQTEGLVKLITDTDDRLLAAHVIGPHAADIVQEVTAYITLGATLSQLRETIHIHPTVSEVLLA